MNKKVPLHSILFRSASLLAKQAWPEMDIKGRTVDLEFEHLDPQSRMEILDDLEMGLEIKKVTTDPVPMVQTIKMKDLDPADLGYLNFYREHKGGKPSTHVILDYDTVTHSIEPIYSAKLAKKGVTYSKGCAMVPAPEDIAKSVMVYGKKNISEEDLYKEDVDQGREDDIHITLFYGFTSDNTELIAKILKETKPFTVRLGLVNAFKDNKDYDVLKISVESGELEQLHYRLEKETENKNDFPTYAPHMTIAYVKKGKADKYIGDDKFMGIKFKADSIIYSDNDNKRTSMPIG